MGRFSNIVVQLANGVKTITLNRLDKRNALSPLLIEELTVALREAAICECGVVILTGRLFKAQEALQLGLVTEIVSAEELMRSAHALAQTLLQNSPPRHARGQASAGLPLAAQAR